MSVRRKILAFFFSERCPYCRAVIEPEQIACDKCLQKLTDDRKPVIKGVQGYRCVSSFIYGGRVRRMLLRIKYRGRPQYIPQTAEILAKDITGYYKDGSFDVITYVPMHPRDQKERGFNQSELLAEELSRILDVPCEGLLLKIKRTKPQHTLKKEERKTNLNGAFKIIDGQLIRGKRILIIDDIVTSGVTLGKCCQKLRLSKPELLCCATIARTEFNSLDENII